MRDDDNMKKYIKLLICSLMMASFMIQPTIIEAKDIEQQNNADAPDYSAKSDKGDDISSNINSSHIDSSHIDSSHIDSSHIDSSHIDSSHIDSSHIDSSHIDSSHVDSSHVDSLHVDSPHAGNDHLNEIRRNISQEKEQMVGRLTGRISNRTISAMTSVPRELFVPADQRRQAYDNAPLPIGFGQTISSPDMVAKMCDLLDLQEGMSVLDIGGGSGYHAAVIANLVGPKGQVCSIERIHEIAVQEKENLKRAGVTNVIVIEGDGSLGLPKYAPYDRINAAACAPQIPDDLKQQLKIGGKMILPVGGIVQDSLPGNKNR